MAPVSLEERHSLCIPCSRAQDVSSSPNLQEMMGKSLIFSPQSLQDLPSRLCWHHCPRQWALLPCPALGVLPASLPSTRELQTRCAELIQTQPADQHLLQEAWDLGNPPLRAPVLSFGFSSRSISSIPPSITPTCPGMGTAPKGSAGAPILVPL